MRDRHRKPDRRPWPWARGCCVSVAAIAGFWWVAGRTASTATTIRLAVLPLENLTGDPEQDYLCDGVTEELIAQLGAADPDALKVIARTSAMHYRNTTKRADEIGRELDVQYLLETSLRRVGDRVRVTAQLVSTATQDHVWSEQYDHHFNDALALQRQVAVAVVRRATTSLGVALKTAARERPPVDSAAYRTLPARPPSSAEGHEGRAREGARALSECHRARYRVRACLRRPRGSLHVARRIRADAHRRISSPGTGGGRHCSAAR